MSRRRHPSPCVNLTVLYAWCSQCIVLASAYDASDLRIRIWQNSDRMPNIRIIIYTHISVQRGFAVDDFSLRIYLSTRIDLTRNVCMCVHELPSMSSTCWEYVSSILQDGPTTLSVSRQLENNQIFIWTWWQSHSQQHRHQQSMNNK